MLDLLWLIPALPFFGFLLLAVFGSGFPKKLVAFIGAGTVGISALLTIFLGIHFINGLGQQPFFNQAIASWISLPGFSANFSLHLDALSLVFIFVITFVGFLIHLYSTAFMAEDEGYARFFAYMNLFVGAMLTLVVADNLLLLYMGWEGVGLCSYLLIGFWYKDKSNGHAARKAFIVTRIGDTAMAIGLFLLFTTFHTFNIHDILSAAPGRWPAGSTQALTASLLLLGGAVGKSAQLPLQTWLPDAMAGPSPVSALIHAATMVTAGVYLIARTHVVFMLAPVAMHLVAIIGAATLLLAGFSALTQKDIKRVLAYSTISQIGYMFLALGVGAWSAAIFHFMIHAFFKSLLFLGAGVIIMRMHDEHDMFKMGGLRRAMPVTFWTYLIASASLSALPLVTAGFYSKDLILWRAWSSDMGSTWLWGAGILGALLTSVYTFRMVFLTFYGEMHNKPERKSSITMMAPLVILAFLSIAGGFVDLPRTLGNWPVFSDFINTVLPKAAGAEYSISTELIFQVISAIVALSGVGIAYFYFLRKPEVAYSFKKTAGGKRLFDLWYSGWGFDTFYDKVFVQPMVFLAGINKNDFIDLVYTGIAAASRFFNKLLSATQTGHLRWYLAGIVLGAIVSFTLMIVL